MFSYNRLFYTLLTLTCFLRTSTASGEFEGIVHSAVEVVFASKVCTTRRCAGIEKDAKKNTVLPNVSYHFSDAHFHTVSRYYDLFFGVFKSNGELQGSLFLSPDTTTKWQIAQVSTVDGFNVTVRYRIKCDDHFYGSRCERECRPNVHEHTDCSISGERICMHGWTGHNCMTPVCENNCNGNGACVAPGKCSCYAQSKKTGPNCDQCIPKKGCVHGGCANNVSDTCTCFPGYGGELCENDLEYCTRHRPCANGGKCSTDVSKRFTCECPVGFVGDRCQIAVETVQCQHAAKNEVCMNGGICYSLDSHSIHCKCKPGFYGKFCELSSIGPCASIDCKNGGTCHLQARNLPVCQCATCYKGSRCEVLDAECLVNKMTNGSLATSMKVHNTLVNLEAPLPMHERNPQIFWGIAAVCAVSVITSAFVIGMYIIYCKFKNVIHQAQKKQPDTPDSVSSFDATACTSVANSTRASVHGPRTYKICEIDSAQVSNEDASSKTDCSRCSSPPPAYYPPPKYSTNGTFGSPGRPAKYQTLPTSDAVVESQDIISSRPTVATDHSQSSLPGTEV